MIVFLVIAAFLIILIVKATSNGKKSQITTSKTETADTYQQMSDKQKNVIRQCIQAMETVHIMSNSKAVDTVIGRYDLFVSLVIELMLTQQRGLTQYLQNGIDEYKNIYYDRIPTDVQLLVVTQPASFDVANFYCSCLINSLRSFGTDQIREIQNLKRNDAKQRRIVKFYETTHMVESELKSKCPEHPKLHEYLDLLEQLRSSLRHSVV